METRAPVRRIRTAAIAVALVSWVSSASAGPGVIVAPRVEVFDEPSDQAKVVAELGRGAAIVVIDEEDRTEAVHARAPGWLAIRLPYSGGVGYVRIEAVDLTTEPAQPAADPAAPAAEPAAAPPTPDPSPGLERAPTRALAGRLRPPFEDEPPAPARPSKSSPVPRTAGGFLPLRPTRFLLGLGSGVGSLREQTARQNHIGSSGALVDFTLGFTIYDLLTISGTAGLILTSDDDSFTEVVVPQLGGDPRTVESSLTVARYSIAAGLRTPFWGLFSTQRDWFAAALRVDYGWTGVYASRAIANCIDCRADDLEVPGGTFWRVGLDLRFPTLTGKGNLGFSGAYQRYGSGAGLMQEVQLGVTGWIP